MMEKKKLVQVSERAERLHHAEVFDNFQDLGGAFHRKSYSQDPMDTQRYSQQQNFLYKRAMFGLKMYTREEISAMHWQKRKRIIKVHKRTQNELNLWKQSKLIEITNKFLGLFSHPKKHSKESLGQIMLTEFITPDPKFICDMTFKDLGIEKQEVTTFLQEKGLLPANFSTL